MKIAIVDDQKEFLESIGGILSDIDYDFYSFTSVWDMEKTGILFDLILLDIDMPDCDGIEYSRANKDKNIIFITSQNHRMKEAFGNNVYGFIEKNDQEKRYFDIITKAIQDIYCQKTVVLKSEDEVICFIQRDIVYLKYIKYKTVSLMYKDKQYIIKGYTLSELKEQLDYSFLYITRDIVINANMIVDFIGDKLYLKDMRESFAVSRRRKNEIKEYIMKKVGKS